MKKSITVVLVTVLLALMAAVPAAAGVEKTVGEQINLLAIALTVPGDPPAYEFPANTPFHIQHGSLGLKGVNALNNPDQEFMKADGLNRFELEIDGEPVKWDFHRVLHVETPDGLDYKVNSYVTNFPDGLPAGEYLFTGKWYTSCKVYDEPCSQTALFAYFTADVLITFTE